MSKISIGNNVSVYPMPIALVGTADGGRANFMAAGWISRVNASPPLIGIGINKRSLTNALIRKCGAFSINYPRAEHRDRVDYCGLVSGNSTDKSSVFHTFFGALGVPMIEECSLSVECRLADVVDFQTNTLFIGEIAGSYADEACLSDGRPDLKKMDPLLLTMPDNRYWSVGESVGRAWHDGKALIRK